jgi:hypothetical protein
MTTFSEHQAEPNEHRELEARTGLKGFSSWRAVYLGVLVVFAVTVFAMWAFKVYYA